MQERIDVLEAEKKRKSAFWLVFQIILGLVGIAVFLPGAIKFVVLAKMFW